MAHGDPHDKDGGVSFYATDATRLQSYMQAEQQFSQFQSPIFIHANNPYERLTACGEGADFALLGALGGRRVETRPLEAG